MSTTGAGQGGLLLPPRATLLHIGLMKTGTTSLQNAAASLRDGLLDHGVRYPGTSLNHRNGLLGLVGRGWGWGTSPRPEAWDELRAELQAETERRIWLGHELLAESDSDTAAMIRSELGDRTHVVVTVRNYASVLPSAWQQSVKGGRVQGYENWLKAMLGTKKASQRIRLERNRIDAGAVVERWAKVFGPDAVTVVVVDKSTPTLLFDAFEDMLGIERGFLASADQDGYAANRGMSIEEAALLRELNTLMRERLTWPQYLTWVRRGAAASMLGERVPGEHDTPFELPSWAAEIASERSQEFITRIRASGARVVGDLTLIDQPVPQCEALPDSPATVPVDAAVHALEGVIEQGLAERERADYYRERLNVWAESGRTYGPRIGKASGRELLGALVRRVGKRLTGRASAPTVEDPDGLQDVEQQEAAQRRTDGAREDSQ